MPVPDPSNGVGRWSVDLVFLDHEAMPTFVECKRFSQGAQVPAGARRPRGAQRGGGRVGDSPPRCVCLRPCSWAGADTVAGRPTTGEGRGPDGRSAVPGRSITSGLTSVNRDIGESTPVPPQSGCARCCRVHRRVRPAGNLCPGVSGRQPTTDLDHVRCRGVEPFSAAVVRGRRP